MLLRELGVVHVRACCPSDLHLPSNSHGHIVRNKPEATNFTAPASCCGETSTKISHGPTPSGSPEPQVHRGFCPVLHTKVSDCAIVGHRLQAALSDLLGPSPLFHAIGKRGARLLLCNFHTAATKKNTADRNKSGSHVAQLTISVQRFFCLGTLTGQLTRPQPGENSRATLEQSDMHVT